MLELPVVVVRHDEQDRDDGRIITTFSPFSKRTTLLCQKCLHNNFNYHRLQRSYILAHNSTQCFKNILIRCMPPHQSIRLVHMFIAMKSGPLRIHLSGADSERIIWCNTFGPVPCILQQLDNIARKRSTLASKDVMCQLR
jgi:hypothetical protein